MRIHISKKQFLFYTTNYVSSLCLQIEKMTNMLHHHTSMGGGASYQKMEDQEYHVSQNFEKEKERMSKHRYYDGEKMYSDSQIKMKLRQDYNSGGKTLSSYRADKDSYVLSSHWHDQ